MQISFKINKNEFNYKIRTTIQSNIRIKLFIIKLRYDY